MSEAALRIGTVEGEAAVTLAAGELEATFLPGLGLLGTSLRHRGEELLALPGGVAGYRGGNVTGLPGSGACVAHSREFSAVGLACPALHGRRRRFPDG